MRAKFVKLHFFLYAILVLHSGFNSTAHAKTDCTNEVLHTLFIASNEHVPGKIDDLDALLTAFTEGLKPNLNIPEQRHAFELYRRMKFGDPDTFLNQGSMEQLARVISEHPELEKEAFRNQLLKTQERIYPVTKDLAAYIDSQGLSAAQTKSNLFQVEANSGYWKRVLQYEDKASFEQLARNSTAEQKTLFRDKVKKTRELNAQIWRAKLNQVVTPELRKILADPSVHSMERAKKLFHVLGEERSNLLKKELDSKPITQAMIDLVHTIGYHEPELIQSLKSTNGLERLRAYRKILDQRDRLAIELGFADHFDQLVQKLGKPVGIQMPTGTSSLGRTTQDLEQLEKATKAGSSLSAAPDSIKTVRHLSLEESPFRSCLGGSDCSSRTYFTRALDPNYHYFTLTDQAGVSSGHITIVLGEARLRGEKIKLAFIDKIQNVPNTDLPAMIEGVRLSLEEKGYKLSLPDDLGTNNGLSNEALTRSFVEKNIKTEPGAAITHFRPHAHSYNFPNEYSRAEEALSSHAISPLYLADGFQITPGKIVHPWKISDLDLNRLVEASTHLKNSKKLADRMRYIPSMKAVSNAGLKVDPEFSNMINFWLSDEGTPIALRKQALLHEWTGKRKPLFQVLSKFNPSERVQVLQNLMDTPRYQDIILHDKKTVPTLLMVVRDNKKIRDALIHAYADEPKQILAIELVVMAADMSDTKKIALIEEVIDNLISTDLNALIKIQKSAKGTSLEEWFSHANTEHYLGTFKRAPQFSQSISSILSSNDPMTRDFGLKLVSKASDPNFIGTKLAKAYQGIAEFQRAGSASFDDALYSWLQSEKVNPGFKADFLLASYNSDEKMIETYRSLIPKDQIPLVLNSLDRISNIGLFEKLATNNGVRLNGAKIESFQFEAHSFPKEGKPSLQGNQKTNTLHEIVLTKPFEIQATPVTQLQWALVMGENPSHFTRGGKIVHVDGKGILMQPNHPVEQVSWEDAQKYIQRLNQMNSQYTYRLPTAAEREYAARAGTKTNYSFGDNPSDHVSHSWNAENSERQTHEVASLQPNGDKLYDMHGNVFEWVQDWNGKLPEIGAIDPLGPSVGTNRGITGGSWGISVQMSASHKRMGSLPSTRNNMTGFRLVRVSR